MATLKSNLKNIAAMAVLVGTILFVTSVGVGDMIDICMGNTANTDLSVETQGVFGADGVDTVERISTMFIAVAGLSTLGLIGASRSNPKAVNDILKWTPAFATAICLTTYMSEFSSIIQGEFVWSAHNEGYVGMLLVLTRYTVWTLTDALSRRNA